MAYRNGTYIAFHANGTSNPRESDMKYYNTLKMWIENENIEFSMINSHEKTSSVRDSSKKETLENSILERLRNSKNFLIIINETTKYDNDWVPFEIRKAIDTYNLPVIAVYPEIDPDNLPIGFPPNDYCIDPYKNIRSLWPEELKTRIDNKTAKTIHIPFKLEEIRGAIVGFIVQNRRIAIQPL